MVCLGEGWGLFERSDKDYELYSTLTKMVKVLKHDITSYFVMVGIKLQTE